MNHKNLIAYKKAFNNAMKCRAIAKGFPKDELFMLTSQITRSSRSVVSNLTEGYRKRAYPKHFKSKLTDADSENSETDLWLDFAVASGYVTEFSINELRNEISEVGKLLNYMINNPDKFQ